MCLEKIPSAAEVNQLGSSGLLHYHGKLNAGPVYILVTSLEKHIKFNFRMVACKDAISTFLQIPGEQSSSLILHQLICVRDRR